MRKIKNLIAYAKNLSKEPEAWALAYRAKKEKALYEGDASGFIVIPNTARYWKADPFLFTYKRKTYVFCEMYDRIKHKGVIGVAKLKHDRCSRFRVCLELPFHLSFPNVFQDGDDVFMLPECGASGEITVFRAVRFPMRWEKSYTIAAIPGRDTVAVPNNGKADFYLSTVEGNGHLAKFRQGERNYHTVFAHVPAARCAGCILCTPQGLVRPSQNDEGNYGNALHFNLIDDSSFDGYKEHLFLRVLPPESKCGENEICIQISEPAAIRYSGVHTYNCNESFEIVDLVYYGAENRVIFWNNRKKFKDHIIKKL